MKLQKFFCSFSQTDYFQTKIVSATLIFAFSGLILLSCTKEQPAVETYQPTPYEIEIPYGFPTLLNIPDDNPMTVEGVELGRVLFYDGRLNGRTHPDSLMSCATCHRPENSFEIGQPRPYPFGVTGNPTHHAMLPLINLVWNMGTYGWNGSVPSIEADVLLVISSAAEFDSSPERVVNTISNIAGYPELFRKAFGTPEVTPDRIAKAIAQFIRTLISSNTRFDKRVPIVFIVMVVLGTPCLRPICFITTGKIRFLPTPTIGFR